MLKSLMKKIPDSQEWGVGTRRHRQPSMFSGSTFSNKINRLCISNKQVFVNSEMIDFSLFQPKTSCLNDLENKSNRTRLLIGCPALGRSTTTLFRSVEPSPREYKEI